MESGLVSANHACPFKSCLALTKTLGKDQSSAGHLFGHS